MSPHRAPWTIAAPSADEAIRSCERQLGTIRFASRLWERDPSLWTADPAQYDPIRNRLGWLAAPEWGRSRLSELEQLASAVQSAGLDRIVLLGMGGSSLAADVLVQVLPRPARRRFLMLDTTDPDAIAAADTDLDRSLFIVASKSGTTIETNALAAYFAHRLTQAGVAAWSQQFVAITDPGTPLAQRARTDGFRRTLLNPPDIGGRFSALSYFGLAPAVVAGCPVEALLDQAAAMLEACRRDDPRENPGLALGAVLAGAAASGRDKLALILPPELRSFGPWVEQLVAESTGKNDGGILPVLDDPAADASSDRLLVRFDAAGLNDASAVGAELVRWEVAIAAAGALLGVNPFDEPNVEQAKAATSALLAAYAERRALPARAPDEVDETASVTVSGAARTIVGGRSPWRLLHNLAGEGDRARGPYVAVLMYLPPGPGPSAEAARLRTRLAHSTRAAVTVAYGPRYLHSTGQLHKGGRNSGYFLIVTAPPERDLLVPGEPWSFGLLEQAQALGDFTALDERGRRALWIHLTSRDPACVRAAFDRLLDGLV